MLLVKNPTLNERANVENALKTCAMILNVLDVMHVQCISMLSALEYRRVVFYE